MKVRHPKTEGVVAIDDAQAETFKQMGYEPVGDDVPTDAELRDLAGMLARVTGDDLTASDDIGKLRAAHRKVFSPSQGDDAARDSGRITGAGESADDQPGRKVHSTANREKSE